MGHGRLDPLASKGCLGVLGPPRDNTTTLQYSTWADEPTDSYTKHPVDRSRSRLRRWLTTKNPFAARVVILVLMILSCNGALQTSR